MNCEQYEARLIAYMDGRASEAERREVELHLVACSACRERVEEFGRLWGVLDETPAEQVSPAFDARLRARIAADPARGTSLLGWLLPQPRLALAMSLLLALGVWIGMLPPAQNPSEVARAASEEEFKMIQDLPVLEDLDMLANFEALAEVPPAQKPEQRKM